MSDEKKCFIIMPITTPELFRDSYRDGDDHFSHVLQCLFIPSIEKAGYVPMPPSAKGSDLIHAEIIKNIETSDLVLCDMSCLNPNVFFEFGIRTSLNKPVSVVKDEVTKNVPFDTGILNYQEYKSSLNPWELETEIKKLTEHLIASATRSKGENTLWRYFGLKSQVKEYRLESGPESKLDFIGLQMESILQKLNDFESKKKEERVPLGSTQTESQAINRSERQLIIQELRPMLPQGVKIQGFLSIDSNRVTILYSGSSMPSSTILNIQDHFKIKYDIRIELVRHK